MSAVDVLSGSVAAERLPRSLVLIGVTALALGDYVWTPVGEKMPGVEVHAQLLENMNEDAFLVRPRWAPIVEALRRAAARGAAGLDDAALARSLRGA